MKFCQIGKLREIVKRCEEKRMASPKECNVPQGCLAVYAGSERKRFIIRLSYLKHPLFLALLEKAEEEYGFDQHGGLIIPCDAILFQSLLPLFGKKKNNKENIAYSSMWCRDGDRLPLLSATAQHSY